MVVASAAPLLAISAARRACPAHHDDCSKTAQWKCCCLEQDNRSNETTPASAKTEIAQPIAATAVVTRTWLAMPGLLRRACISTTVPRSAPPDLITLFGTFLI
jgi:hypothetical protein